MPELAANLGALIHGIAHVGVRVHNLERSRAFYERLGFAFVMGPVGPEPVAIMRHPSGLEINFILNAAQADAVNVLMDGADKHPGYTHIALAVTDVLATQAALEQAGIPLSGGPVRFDSGSTSIFVRDPDRNVLEFNQHTH
jgi:lactoylglutathione lyase